MSTPQVPEKRLYKSTRPSQRIITPTGQAAEFRFHQFATSDPKVIAYLDDEIASGGFDGSVYIDPNARTITAEQENPMLALRKKFFEEFQAEAARRMDPSTDMGTTEVTPLKPTSSTDIAPVAAGGDAAAHLRAVVADRTSKK